jgi:hypothetical protein
MGAGDGPVVGLGLVGVPECVGVDVSGGGVGSLVRDSVGLTVLVGEGVGECGVGDDGRTVEGGWQVGVLPGVGPRVGGKDVGDLSGPVRAVSVAETASAMAVAADRSGSAVLDRGEHAMTNSSKTHHPRRLIGVVLRFTF